MGIPSSGEGGKKNAGANWRVIPALLILAAMGVGASALRAPAQQATPPTAPSAPAAPEGSEHPDQNTEKPHTIRTNVELVNVPVTAKNKRGQPTIDLNMEDFQVFEDGVEQKITHFERETSTPLRLGLILDTSNSARRRYRMKRKRRASLYSWSCGTVARRTRCSFRPSTPPVQSSRTSPTIRIC